MPLSQITCKKFSYSFDWENIKILDSEPNFYKRSVSKMLHIKEQQTDINAQKATELLDDAYFNILDILSKMYYSLICYTSY